MAVPGAPNLHPLDNVTTNSFRVVFDDGSSSTTITNRQIAYNKLSYTPGANTEYPSVMGGHGSSTVTGLQSRTTYYVWARCQNSSGWGAWSSRRSTTTYGLPDSPTTPMVENISPTSVSVSFSANGNGGSPITGFEIGYGDDLISPDTIISATSPQLIESLTPGTTYYYWARARNQWGYSDWSAASNYQVLSGGHIYVDGVWRNVTPYVKVDGEWKIAQSWCRTAGVWKPTN